MIKYKTKEWRCEPEPRIVIIECERESERCVWIDGKRHLKVTDNYIFFNTWNEAHEYILGLANNSVNRAILQLERAKGLLVNIYGLKEKI